MPYPVASVRGRNFGNAPVIPWYLSGGIAAANCIAAYAPKGAADLAASYVNLANPGTYNAAPGTAPTWDATNGWIFLGTSSQYLTTGIVPARQTWSAIIKYTNFDLSGAVNLNKYIFGLYHDANRQFSIVPRLGTSPEKINYESGGSVAVEPLTGAAQTLAIAGNSAYRDGVLETGTIAAGSGTITGQVYIGARNRADITSVDLYITAYIQAVAFYNAALTAPQVLAVKTAMAAL